MFLFARIFANLKFYCFKYVAMIISLEDIKIFFLIPLP